MESGLRRTTTKLCLTPVAAAAAAAAESLCLPWIPLSCAHLMRCLSRDTRHSIPLPMASSLLSFSRRLSRDSRRLSRGTGDSSSSGCCLWSSSLATHPFFSLFRSPAEPGLANSHAGSCFIELSCSRSCMSDESLCVIKHASVKC